MISDNCASPIICKTLAHSLDVNFGFFGNYFRIDSDRVILTNIGKFPLNCSCISKIYTFRTIYSLLSNSKRKRIKFVLVRTG